jgi:hypothetical protein
MAPTPSSVQLFRTGLMSAEGQEHELREQKRPVKTPAFFAQRCLAAKVGKAP